MSDGINMQSVARPDDGYTVKTMGGCRVVFGSVPISQIGMLTHGFSKKALMDYGLADRMGAAFVIGEPGNLAELRKQDLPVSHPGDQGRVDRQKG